MHKNKMLSLLKDLRLKQPAPSKCFSPWELLAYCFNTTEGFPAKIATTWIYIYIYLGALSDSVK